MLIDLNPQVINRLVQEFRFKTVGDHLREGVCPACGKKTLWTWVAKPGMVQCNRTNNCTWQATSKELFPDLFEDLNKKYPATPEIPNQTADAYLSLIRGFNPNPIKGWYEQGKYWHPHGDKGTASVRFYLNADKTAMWERLIDDVTITDPKDGSKETRNKNFKGSFKGLWWQPPGFTINEKDDVYWCEGIPDAIALNLSGFKAVAIMSSGTFPTEAIKPHLKKKVKWVIAIDNDSTGRRCLQKHAKKLRDLGEELGAAISSDTEEKQDWNDLYKAQKLTEKDMVEYRHLGDVELAPNHFEKAHTIWKHNDKKKYFVFEFRRITYSFSIDESEFKKSKQTFLLASPEKLLQAEKDAFINASKIKQIAGFKIDFLYFQRPASGEEGQFFFRLTFANNAEKIMTALPGKVLSGTGDFKKAIANDPSALWEGTTKDIDEMRKQWMVGIPKIVKTLDFIGYDSSTGAYVYMDYAVEEGKIIKLNKESFHQLKKTGIKTTMDIPQKLNDKLSADWLPDYQAAFGTGGMVALSWWLGSLFVEQVRKHHQSYPFFEVVGEPGSGKTDMVSFLFKTLGMDDDSFNPNDSTLPGFIRKMAEKSNLPVVFSEVENAKIAEDRHQKLFDWERIKDAFTGVLGRVTGVKSQDNSTKKATFKAALMIVQNVHVVASEAITSRITSLQFDRTHHTPQGKQASDRLNMLPVMEVSGFLLHSVTRADAVLAQFDKQFVKHRLNLQGNPLITMQRIIENHAKIMAFADCLPLVLPSVTAAAIADIHRALIGMAETRQESLNEEHPIVQQFWATFDYLDSRVFPSAEGEAFVSKNQLNHSNSPETEIAINLVNFGQVCREHKVEVIDDKLLRRHLQLSRKRLYLRNEPIRSRLEGRTIRCWIFKR